MKVLITGGIGDFIAIESHMPLEVKESVEFISLGCFHNLEIKEIIQRCKNSFCKLKSIDFFFSDFVQDQSKKIPVPNNSFEKKIKEQEEKGFLNFSMQSYFDKIIKKEVNFTGSCLFKDNLSDISEHDLPLDYFVVFPYSMKALPNRQYNKKDWDETLRILKYKEKIGVVITQNEMFIPNHKNLIVLKNQTKICDVIEIIKKSQGFIGIDTFAATISAQMPIYIKVKSTNKKTHEWKKHIYFAPRKNFYFLGEQILCSKLMI